MENDRLSSPLGDLNDHEFRSLLQQARAITRQRFGRVVQLYAPLYLSNECTDTCVYCGFSLANKVPRKTLTIPEAREEADCLIRQGFRHLLLVSGNHPTRVDQGYLEELIRLLRPRLASIAIEVTPFPEETYRRLIGAGLDGVVLYQETYDRERYGEVHRGGIKKSYERRLAAPEEVAQAGIRQLGMGVLLGLSDWRREATALVAHVRSLKKRYWQTEISISLPRLRPSASDFRPPSPVSDREFVQLVAALRVILPDVGLVLSTRESPLLRDTLIGLGITRMSAGSRTEPGGYLHPEEALEQFYLEDRRSAIEVARVIAQKGYEPVWKDWERML